MNKKNIFYLSFAFMAVIFETSCSNNLNDDTTPPQETTTLQIKARDNSNDVSYPIQIYAFNKEGKQAGTSSINSADENYSIQLPKGNYHLMALANISGYILVKSTEESSKVSMPEQHYNNNGLMMGEADINLQSDKDKANISLNHQTSRIDLSLMDIPEKTKTVKASFSPVYHTINFDGTYKTSTTATLDCTLAEKQWKTPTFYIFPDSQTPLTISIEVTAEDGTKKTHTYTNTTGLAAGTPYALKGSYKGNIKLMGGITSNEWKQQVVIDFPIGEEEEGGSPEEGGDSGESGDNEGEGDNGDENYIVTAIPESGTLWNGQLVVENGQTPTGTSTDLLLLSLEEWQNVKSAKADATAAISIANEYKENEKSGWRIPNEDEAKKITACCGGSTKIKTINKLLKDAGGKNLTGSEQDPNNKKDIFVRYLSENGVSSYNLDSDKTENPHSAGATRTYYLRLVKTVHVTLTTNP